MMSDNKQQREVIEHLGKLICDIPVAMLTTAAADDTLHSRPMVNVNSHFQGELWFFTFDDDPKVEEIRANGHVNAAFASPEQGRYVSISGTATTVKDAKRNVLMWTDDCRPWFPEGPDNPKLALVRIEVEKAEYWDAHKNRMVRFAGFFPGLGSASAKSVKHEKLDWQTDGTSQPVPPREPSPTYPT